MNNISLLDITNLTHSFGDKTLYKDASFSLYGGEHLAIVGQNGAGKSTFINICSGEIVADKGQIIWNKGIKIGYLDQHAKIDKNVSIIDFLKSAFSELYDIEKKMIDLYHSYSIGNDEDIDKALALQDKLDSNHFYDIDTEIEKTINGLGISSFGIENNLKTLSGGQRAKVILAKLLLSKPDVLLMDEPTNFLDKEHIDWLSNFLISFKGAFMIVSHDFDFIENVANSICDIDNKDIRKYNGKYSEFLKQKQHLQAEYLSKYNSQQREIKKTEEFIRRNIAGSNSKNARGRRKQLERMEKLEAPENNLIVPQFHFLEDSEFYDKALILNDLSIGYQKPLFNSLNIKIDNNKKVAITGFNGIGKSTLLKTLVKEINPLSGSFYFSDKVNISYYEQNLNWEDKKKTPIQIMHDYYKHLDIKEIRKMLSKCGLKGEKCNQAISDLSGGEQVKLKLCILMFKKTNFLILDEPTNHLDKNAKDSLKNAIKNFNRNVLIVSHEPSFYSDIIDYVIDIEKLKK